MTSLKRARRMMAYHGAVRGALLGLAASSLLGAASGAFAQQGGLDFRLPPADDGRDSNVQGPTDNGLPPAPRPVTPPPTKSTVPSVSSQASPQPKAIPSVPKAVTTTPKAVTPTPKAAPSTPKAVSPTPKAVVPVPQQDPAAPTVPEPAPVTETLPAVDTSASVPADSAVADSSAVVNDITQDSSAAAASEEAPWWAWPLAMLIAVFAGYFYWRRQNRIVPDAVETPAVAATESGPASAPAPRAAPEPKAPPARAPIAPIAQPQPAQPSGPAAPRSAASDGFVTAKPLVRRPADEMRADISMEVEVRSLRVEADHVAVGFLLTLSNRGAMDAASLMVRIALGQGSAMNEAVLNRFYDGAGGSVLRDDIDLPAGRSEQLSSEVKLPRQSIEPLMMSGRPMMVPVLAADVTYHWDGTGEAFGQIAAAYVLGRASVGGSDKLAPIPLDQVPLAVDRPSGRATAMIRRQ